MSGGRHQHCWLVAALCALSSTACDPTPEVLPDGEAGTSESAQAVQVAIALAEQPSGVVTVLADSTDPGEPVASDSVRFDRIGTLFGGVTASWAGDVSADGEVVVGWSAGRRGDEAFRWTPASGIRSLGAGGGTSRAYAVSPDGTLVTGAAKPLNQPGGGALWRGDAPLELLAGAVLTPGQAPYFAIATGYAVTDQGSVYGECSRSGSLNGPFGCLWSGPGQLEALPASSVFAADAVGNFAGTLHASYGSAAILNGDELPYAQPCSEPEDCGAAARAFSQGATVVVGTSLVPAQDEQPAAPSAPVRETAFVYSEGEGTLPLPRLLAEQQGSGAYDISANARVIGGYVSSEERSHAVIWVDREPFLVADLLSADSRAAATGWSLLDVRAVSADGRTLVGNGRNPSGRAEAFRVVLLNLP